MTELLKIGFSVRPVAERIAELNAATGVPTPFELQAYFVSANPPADEKEIHLKLAAQRNPGKEFFKVSLAEALSVAQAVCGRPPDYLNSNAAGRNSSSRQNSEPKTWKSSLREKLHQAAKAAK